jgi:hypothetical protein
MKEIITVLTCDRCKKKDQVGMQTVCVPYDRDYNVESCDKCKVADLCPECLAHALKEALKSIVRNDSNTFVCGLWGGIAWREELR